MGFTFCVLVSPLPSKCYYCILSSKSFVVLFFISVLHPLKLIGVWCEVGVQLYLPPCSQCTRLLTTSFIDKSVLSPLICSIGYVIKLLFHVYFDLCMTFLCFIGWLSIPEPVSHYLNFYLLFL